MKKATVVRSKDIGVRVLLVFLACVFAFNGLRIGTMQAAYAQDSSDVGVEGTLNEDTDEDFTEDNGKSGDEDIQESPQLASPPEADAGGGLDENLVGDDGAQESPQILPPQNEEKRKPEYSEEASAEVSIMAVYTGYTPDGYHFTVDTDTGEATVVSRSDSFKDQPLNIPASVVYNAVTYPVTTISGSAFYASTQAPSISIPSSVTTIGRQAFSGCSGATGTLTILSSVTSLGDEAFKGCTKITAIDIQANIDIPEGCFSGCGITGHLTLPNNAKDIGPSAFANCPNLTEVTFGSGTKVIGAKAFSGNLSLEAINISTSVTTIGDVAFSSCGLVDLVIPANVETIGKNAFSQNERLESIQLNEGLNEIQEYAFSYCYKLGGTVSIPDSVTKIGDSVFYDCPNIEAFQHQKLAGATGALAAVPWPIEMQLPTDFESSVEFNTSNTEVTKSSKWANEDLTEIEIVLQYAQKQQRELDVIFVVDYSTSMLFSTPVMKNSVEYMYPRSLLMDDILKDCVDIVLGANGAAGYNNRVAITAFGGEAAGVPYSKDIVWSSGGFDTNANTLKNQIHTNVVAAANATHYAPGLQEAIDLIEGRSDTSRIPVVIFLSDGDPWDIEGVDGGDAGATEAEELRQMGVGVYPIAMYLDPADTRIDYSSAMKALKEISFDKNTCAEGRTTTAFSSALVDTLEGITYDIHDRKVVDYLSDHFLNLADLSSVTVQTSQGGGSATVKGDGSIEWDLNGCLASTAAKDKAYVHQLTIKAPIKDGTDSGFLDTNAGTNHDGQNIEKRTPTLERYIATHEFVGKGGVSLPHEVMSLLPDYSGGYRNGAEAKPSGLVQEKVAVQGGYWIFNGWDAEKKTIQSSNVEFAGEWEFSPLGSKGLEDLTVVKSVDKTKAKPGETLTYTITATNTGDENLTGIMIRDYIPAYTAFVECDNNGTYGVANGKNHVTWIIGSLAPHETVDLKLVVKIDEQVPAKTKVANTALYGAGSGNPNSPTDPTKQTNTAGTEIPAESNVPPKPNPTAGTGNPGSPKPLSQTGDMVAGQTLLAAALSASVAMMILGARRLRARK